MALNYYNFFPPSISLGVWKPMGSLSPLQSQMGVLWNIKAMFQKISTVLLHGRHCAANIRCWKCCLSRIKSNNLEVLCGFSPDTMMKVILFKTKYWPMIKPEYLTSLWNVSSNLWNGGIQDPWNKGSLRSQFQQEK